MDNNNIDLKKLIKKYPNDKDLLNAVSYIEWVWENEPIKVNVKMEELKMKKD